MKKKHPTKRVDEESSALSRSAFAAISAVEGLKLSKAGRKRVFSADPVEVRRLEVLRAYVPSKAAK